jgi:DNA-binding transcriptional LysR family regulator
MPSLSIAFVPGVSPAKWARVWRERFPDVELVLVPIAASAVDEALKGDVDMVFARLPVADDHNAIPLWQETPVVAAPKDSVFAAVDSLTPADLDGATILVDRLGGTGPLASTVPEDLDGLLDLVEAGVGVAVLPQSLFRAASRKPLVGRPIIDVEPTRVALVWRPQDASELTDEFIGVVRGRTANSSRGATPAAPPPSPAPRSKAARGGGSARSRSGSGRSGGSSRTRRGRPRSR